MRRLSSLAADDPVAMIKLTAIADEELARHCLPIVMPSPADVPMAAAVLVYRPRSEPMPTVAIPVPDVATPANVPFACLGVALRCAC